MPSWKKNQLLFKSWSDEYYRTAKCDKCRVLLLTSTYKHNGQEYRVAFSTNKSHGTGWLCHSCATRKPNAKTSRREKAFATYEQLDNYLIYRIKKEKELWFGKKSKKTGNYTSINEKNTINS
tara:strand:+ start:215 stop:580 length:366 start_codon:yes stop_codon:yes gene_type:complete